MICKQCSSPYCENILSVKQANIHQLLTAKTMMICFLKSYYNIMDGQTKYQKFSRCSLICLVNIYCDQQNDVHAVHMDAGP